MFDALRLYYEAEIEKARANIEVYVKNPVGIGEHPDLVSAIDSQMEIIAGAEDKLAALKKYYHSHLRERKPTFLQEGAIQSNDENRL